MKIDFTSFYYLLKHPHIYFVSNPNDFYASDWKESLENFAMELEQSLSEKNLGIQYSWGIGRWAYYPWIRIFLPELNTTNSKGLFIDYLFGWKDSEVYLTLLQGVDSDERVKIIETKKKIQEHIQNGSFQRTPLNWHLNIGGTPARLIRAQTYADGMIFHKLYTAKNIPSPETLEEDLKELINIYKKAKGIL